MTGAAVTVLGERVVVVRLGGGLSAFRDLCVHRGSALSVGKVVDGDRLECRYHGWTYDREGACVRIPARPGMAIPSKARVRRYDAAEHVGLIWVCLEGPAELPLPEFPQYADPAYHTIKVPTYEWRCGAARRGGWRTSSTSRISRSSTREYSATRRSRRSPATG
jgi:vanillate O-demethylase monooxygenase subunit